MQQFPEDVAVGGGVPGDPNVRFPKLVELESGVAVCDESFRFKRPDWTYAETPVRLG